MNRSAWIAACSSIAVAVAGLAIGACGIDDAGLAPGDDGGGARDASDATTAFDVAADTSAPPTPCESSTTSCGLLGQCADCTASPQGTACIGGSCGCNLATDCPSNMACQSNHVCSSACGVAGDSACNGGCCSAGTCAPFDNEHCGIGECAACGGLTPTCGPSGVCNGNCGGDAGNGVCESSCCNAGTCATIGATSCGDPGTACTDCSGSSKGHACEATDAGHYTCGCDGPSSESQCGLFQACVNNECGSSCDGQHSCNLGCCSGETASALTICLIACPTNTFCINSYCQ